MDDSQVIEDLVLAAAQGSRDAQRELIARYWHVIEQVVRVRRIRGGALKRREETIDVQQEVALRLLEQLGKHDWRGSRAFVAWVRKLADARMIDMERFYRAERRDPAKETREDRANWAPQKIVSGPESRIDRHRQLDALEKLLERLPADQAAALRLHHMGYTHAEVGELIDCSAEAARKTIARGTARLQKLRANIDPN